MRRAATFGASAASLLPVVVLLASCSSVPRTPVTASAPPLPAFSVNGRLLATDGSRRFSASLRWTHGTTTRILLTTPLGQAVASIDVDAGGARLTTAGGEQYAAASLPDLARRGLGLTLPLDQLPWWMNGRGAPDAPIDTTQTDGFTQHGWTVRYGGRDPQGRPLRLDAECATACVNGSQPGAPMGPLSVRIIIDQWLDP